MVNQASYCFAVRWLPRLYIIVCKKAILIIKIINKFIVKIKEAVTKANAL